MAKSRLYMTVCHLSMMGVISILVLQFPIVTQTLSALHYNLVTAFSQRNSLRLRYSSTIRGSSALASATQIASVAHVPVLSEQCAGDFISVSPFPRSAVLSLYQKRPHRLCCLSIPYACFCCAKTAYDHLRISRTRAHLAGGQPFAHCPTRRMLPSLVVWPCAKRKNLFGSYNTLLLD